MATNSVPSLGRRMVQTSGLEMWDRSKDLMRASKTVTRLMMAPLMAVRMDRPTEQPTENPMESNSDPSLDQKMARLSDQRTSDHSKDQKRASTKVACLTMAAEMVGTMGPSRGQSTE